MSADAKAVTTGNKWLSIDSWAVLTAFVLALLIRAGVFKHIPW
jgi:hypothetical protein